MSRKILHAVRDLGAVEGNDTPGAGIYNDRAALKASRHFECEGGYVDGWEGVFRFRSPWRIAGSRAGGLIGVGRGMSSWPPDFSGQHGTVFRHEGQGNFLTLSNVWDFTLRGIGFWPVLHKTSGAEIFINGRSNANNLNDLLLWMPYRAVHVENAVYTDLNHVTSISAFGDAHYYVTGSPTTLSEHNEKTVFSRCNSYQTQRHAQTPEPSTFKNYTPGTPQNINVGDYTETNGHVWQAVQGGTTAGGSGPTPSASWVSAHDRTCIFVDDGTVKWGWYCRSFSSGILVDSGGDYVTAFSCEFNQAAHALKTVNTLAGGTPAKQIKMLDCEIDHCWSHSVWLTVANQIVHVRGNALESSVRGTGLRIESGADNFIVTGNYLGQNGGGNKTIIPTLGPTRIYENNIEVA